MSRIAVFAHYDPQGAVAPHVERHLDALAAYVDDIVVVTTSRLTPAARTNLSGRGRLIERENAGYDFSSWRAGIMATKGWESADELIITNDSVVGPLRSYRQMSEEMAKRGAQVWSATASEENEHHLQSFCISFGPEALSNSFVQAFWLGLAPLSDRSQVVRRYEMGLSRLVARIGLTALPYFEPTASEQRISDLRKMKMLALDSPSRHPVTFVEEVRDVVDDFNGSNPMIGLWDRALQDGRLPFVKLETLRDDPYELGAAKMLTKCEHAFPDEFAGVREYLDRTRTSIRAIRGNTKPGKKKPATKPKGR